MRNCLVTKLKSIVNNDTLSKMGEIKVEVIGGGESDRLNLNISSVGNYYIRTTGDCEIYNGSGETSLGKNYTFTGSIEYLLKGSGFAFIYDNYNATWLTFVKQAYDIEQALARPNISTLKSHYAIISGDLDVAFLGTTTLENVFLNGATFNAFNITSLCNNINLVLFTIDPTTPSKIVGKLEDFVEGFLRNGRKTGSISMYVSGKESEVTLNNSVISYAERINVSFNNETSVVVTRTTGSAVIATYENGTWSYN